MKHKPLRVVSLFTGAGGFDFGFNQPGFKIIGQCDLYDPAAIPSLLKAHRADLEATGWLASGPAAKKRKSIKSNWSELCRYGGELADYAALHWPDVKKVNGVQNVKADTFSGVDVVTGGFPCQDVSIAGRRAGLAGKRSGLWFEFIRAIAEIKPRWVVIENVAGLLSSNKGRDFATVLSGLGQCGYGWGYRILNSQNWGVPQHRRRVFIVGHLGAVCPPEILFERNGGEWYTPTRRASGAKSTGVSEGGVGMGDRELAASIGRSETNGRDEGKPVGALTAYMGKGGGASNDNVNAGRLIVGPVTATSMGTQGGYNNQAEEGHMIPVAFAQNTRNELRAINGDGRISGALAAQPGMKQQTFVAINNGGEKAASTALTGCGNRFDGDSDTFIVAAHDTGQSHWNESEVGGTIRPNGNRPTNIIAATLRSGGNGGVPGSRGNIGQGMAPDLHGGVRRLTPLECERLQDFPDNATAGHSDTTRYKMMGNAVTVSVVRWIAERLLKADRSSREVADVGEDNPLLVE